MHVTVLTRCRGFAVRSGLVCATLLSALPSGAAFADDGALIGIGTRIGPTTGLGFEASLHANRYIDLRAGFNLGRITFNDDYDGTEYRAKLSYTAYAGFIDYKPFGGGFRLSGGLYSNPFKLDLRASGRDEYEFDGRDYNGDLDIAGKLRLGNAAPYLGFGWGGTTNGSGFGASVDVGVQFAKSPDASLRVSGRACDQQLSGANCDPNGPDSFDVDDPNDPFAQAFQADIDGEVRELEHDAKDFKLVPVISFGLHYRFGGSGSASSAAAPVSVAHAQAAAAPAQEAPLTTRPCASCAAATRGAAVATGTTSRPGAREFTLPRSVQLRPQPMPDARSSNSIVGGSRVERSDRQVNASGAWWFVQAPGLAGWVPEAELNP